MVIGFVNTIQFQCFTSQMLLVNFWGSMSYILQSGKSAAIYACAQEQGFEILEVIKLCYYFWWRQHRFWNWTLLIFRYLDTYINSYGKMKLVIECMTESLFLLILFNYNRKRRRGCGENIGDKKSQIVLLD